MAHERVLFEQHLAARRAGRVNGQRLLVPLVTELSPRQLVIFERIAEELRENGFEVEPIGPRSVAIQAAPAGISSADAERLLTEILDGIERENQAISMETLQAKIAASTSCHAAIKVNMPLDQTKMEWLLAELAKTECPMRSELESRYTESWHSEVPAISGPKNPRERCFVPLGRTQHDICSHAQCGS